MRRKPEKKMQRKEKRPNLVGPANLAFGPWNRCPMRSAQLRGTTPTPGPHSSFSHTRAHLVYRRHVEPIGQPHDRTPTHPCDQRSTPDMQARVPASVRVLAVLRCCFVGPSC
jgi:hypothetical protein